MAGAQEAILGGILEKWTVRQVLPVMESLDSDHSWQANRGMSCCCFVPKLELLRRRYGSVGYPYQYVLVKG